MFYSLSRLLGKVIIGYKACTLKNDLNDFWYGFYSEFCVVDEDDSKLDAFGNLITVQALYISSDLYQKPWCLLLPALEPWRSKVEKNCCLPQSWLYLFIALNSFFCCCCCCYYIMPVWEFQLLHTCKSLTRNQPLISPFPVFQRLFTAGNVLHTEVFSFCCNVED